MALQSQFYLMAILVGALCAAWPFFRRRLLGPLLIVVTIASFAWASRGGLYGGMDDYYSTWTRLWQMTLGGATLIMLSDGSGRTGDVLRSAPMQWLGRVAYPLYLWHWQLLILIAHATGNWVVPAWLGLVVIGLSLLLADATHDHVEKPLQEQGPRRTADAPAVPEPYPELPEHIGTRSWRDGCLVKMDAPTDEYPDCVYGDVDAEMTVAIVGHSHAVTYVEPLHILGLERGFRVVTMLREACPLTLRTSWFVERDCVTWSRGAIDRLVDENGKPFYPNRCMRQHRDRDHMTTAYARSPAPLLGEQIDTALAQAGAAAR